ncbi:hypothetical protein BD560DRAFT_493287 [Blakeslea trispora]|nr:hypothetical protein BD560DRAFT_493287 [Blakeslea trispora]
MENDQPSHPGIFSVLKQGEPGSFSSKLVAERDFAEGSVIVNLQGLTPGPKRYSSVQVSPTEHVELNSDLLYLNHSCNPSTYLDVTKRSLMALQDIKKGDELTFFYPSTEWDMAQPFDCWCGSEKCIGKVDGARNLPAEKLQKFMLSDHIRQLLKERDTTV